MSRGTAVVAVALVVLAGCSGGGKKTATTTTTAPSLAHSASAAAAIAKKKLTVSIPTSDVQTYVLDLCGAATSHDRTLIDDDLKHLALTNDSDLRSTITALGDGAQAYCPDGVKASPNLLNDVYADLAAATGATTTTAGATSTTSTDAGF